MSVSARVTLPARYRIVGHLASGGMASVWEAHDELLDRDVAVKVLAAHLSDDERGRARFQREARAAASLSSHPHVVTIYDVGEHAGRAFMVMEIMRGGTLGDRLAGGRPIDRDAALRWLREAAGALDAAHEAGIVHRDVKPGNLLLDQRERLAIADFGIARVAREEQLTGTGQVLGTAAYISPEQAMGELSTAASDRYALGVVAYELLTGERPFPGANFAVQARAHVEDEPPPATTREPALPAAVDPVLERALAKQPLARWRSGEAMVDALEQALASAPRRRRGPRRSIAAGGRRAQPDAQAGGRRAQPDAQGGGRRAQPDAQGGGRRAQPDAQGGGRRAQRDAPAPRRPVAAGEPGAPGRRRRGLRLPLALTAAVLVAAVAAVLLLERGSGADTPLARTTPTRTATPAPTRTPRATATASATPTATATASPTAPTSTAGLTEARSLQLSGYDARLADDYTTALADARAALAACGDQRALDPCGYALYEEGVALNRRGDHAAAIAVLEERLSLYGDNDQGVVAAELADAQAAASGSSSSSSGSGGSGSGRSGSGSRSGASGSGGSGAGGTSQGSATPSAAPHDPTGGAQAGNGHGPKAGAGSTGRGLGHRRGAPERAQPGA